MKTVYLHSCCYVIHNLWSKIVILCYCYSVSVYEICVFCFDNLYRYLQTDKAYTMYDQMMEEKLPVDLLTFNELIRAATFHKDTYETKWKQVIHFFVFVLSFELFLNCFSFSVTFTSFSLLQNRSTDIFCLQQLQFVDQYYIYNWCYIKNIWVFDHLEATLCNWQGIIIKPSTFNKFRFYYNALSIAQGHLKIDKHTVYFCRYDQTHNQIHFSKTLLIM